MRFQPRPVDRTKERNLRKAPTDAEQVLWAILRDRRRAGMKFRRQHRIGSFILDFYAPELELGIELDCDPHFTEQGRGYDDIRERMLNERGIRILRFENREACEPRSGSREDQKLRLSVTPLTPDPSPR